MWTLYAIPLLIVSIILLAGPSVIREIIDLLQEISWWIGDKFRKKQHNIITDATPILEHQTRIADGTFIRNRSKEDEILSDVKQLISNK